MTPKRCYPVEQVVVNERWWRRAFPLLQGAGAAQSDICAVVHAGYRSCLDIVGGVDIFQVVVVVVIATDIAVV